MTRFWFWPYWGRSNWHCDVPANPQVITCLLSKVHHLSHQPRLHTGSIRPSHPWAAAHWPIREARVPRQQPAWRPTCKVRRNASSCRTAGSWAAMSPWRAGEWPTMTCKHTWKIQFQVSWNVFIHSEKEWCFINEHWPFKRRSSVYMSLIWILVMLFYFVGDLI